MRTRFLTIALGAVPTVLPLQAQFVFNAAAEFSTNHNPNGAWSYGWFPRDTTAFALHPDMFVHPNVPGREGWHTADLDRGSVACNMTDAVVCDEWGICLRPHSVTFHPGPGGERGVFRWTAPMSGRVDIVAGFAPADSRAMTDVHIWVSGNRALFDGDVPGSGPGGSVEWRGSLAVAAGDTVDFFVGWGDIQRHCCQTTYIDATITLHTEVMIVPEPPTLTENIGTAILSAVRCRDVGTRVAFAYEVTGGTATPEEDFLLPGGVLEFAAGVTNLTIPLTIMNDTLPEGPETILLSVTNLADGWSTTLSLTILDNDSGIQLFSSSSHFGLMDGEWCT